MYSFIAADLAALALGTYSTGDESILLGPVLGYEAYKH
jgi:hypothetical protein